MADSAVFEAVGQFWQHQKANPSTPCKCLNGIVYLHCITNTYQQKSVNTAKDYTREQVQAHLVFSHKSLWAAPETGSFYQILID